VDQFLGTGQLLWAEKPAPNHLKLLRGDRKARLNTDEPIPAESDADLTRPPRGIGAKAGAVWRRLAPDLVDKGCLTLWDTDLFGAFCTSVAQYDDARRLVQEARRDGVG
jgi:phage terminase small subunit